MFEEVSNFFNKVAWWWNNGTLVFLVAVLPIFLLVGWRLFWKFFRYEVLPFERTSHLRRGKPLDGVKRVRKQGWYYKNPLTDVVRTISIGERTTKIEETVRTADNNILTINGAIHWSVIDDDEVVETVIYSIGGLERLEGMVTEVVLSNLRSSVGSSNASACFGHQDEIAKKVIEGAKEQIKQLGGLLHRIPLGQIEPHESVTKAMLSVQEAEMSSLAAAKRADGVKTQIIAEAEANRQAAELRGQGEASRLEAEAEGMLNMLRTLTGEHDLTLDVNLAVGFTLQMRSLQMKSDFAKSGRGSCVVLPDERGPLQEIQNLVPALLTHEGVDGNSEKELDSSTVEELEQKIRAASGPEMGEEVEQILAQIKAKGQEMGRHALDAALEKVPEPLKVLFRHLAKIHSRNS